MKTFVLFTLFCFGSTAAALCQKTAYVIYDAKGKKVSYEKMLKSLLAQDIVLFGELHDNPIAHWLELELAKDIAQKKELTIGAEMFEADNQKHLSAFVKEEITEKEFDSLVRLWSNYATDYAPLVRFAQEKKLTFIATNIPRKYASLVYKKGFSALDSLTLEEKSWMAPLPMAFDPELPRYKNILAMMGDHGTAELVMAQATKDATMAHFILKNFNSGGLFIHYNGAYHSDYREGILWYLKIAKPELNYATISTVLQEDIHKLENEHRQLADFIICVDSDMTSTYE